MAPSDNRHTQLDMLALADAESLSLTPSSKSAGLQGSQSPGRTSQRDALNKKRARSLGEDALKAPPETGKARSRLDRSATTGSLRLRAAWESPWKKYKKVYDLELGDPVEVAVRKAPPVELVHVRAFPKPAVEKTLYMFRHIQNCNIVAALDAFITDDGLYVVLEYMHVSLEQIVRSPAYPDERELAAILGQVSSLIHARASTDHDRS